MTKDFISSRTIQAVNKKASSFQIAAIQAWFIKNKQTLSVAESCTGGLLSYILTRLPGASQFFIGSVVSYSHQIKSQILQITPALLKKKGATNAEICELMARGVKKLYKSHWAMAITGVAGPSKSALDPPVGTVFVGLVGKNTNKVRQIRCLKKNRQEIQKEAVFFALDFLHSGIK